VSGHGWVTPLPGGAKAKCGGPGLCAECAQEQAQQQPGDLGARELRAALALGPMGLHLVIHPGAGYTVTDKPGESSETSVQLRAIDDVEHYIAGCQATAAAKSAEQRKPRVGDVVHYVSHGTPVRGDGTQAYTSQCRAAIVTEVTRTEVNERNPAGDGTFREAAGLCVLNPDGIFLKGGLLFDDGQGNPGDPDCPHAAYHGQPHRYCPGCSYTEPAWQGGTWHWADHE
jgi:hypothetical protein